MTSDQIFISYSHKNKDVADRLYNRLLWDGYWVWMDPKIEEGKRWRPQIDHNIKLSNKCIVLISAESVDAPWVRHEVSMAYGKGAQIIPIQIKDYSPKVLPLGVDEIQLFKIMEGEVDYEYQFKKLEDFLGTPLDIQKHLEEMLIHYKISKIRLSEVAIRLYDKHKSEIVWPPGQKELGEEMVETSRRELLQYWEKYEMLEEAYKNTQRENIILKENAAYVFRIASAFILLVDLVLVWYMFAYLAK